MRSTAGKTILFFVFLSFINFRCETEIAFTDVIDLVRIGLRISDMIGLFDKGSHDLSQQVITASQKTSAKLSANSNQVQVAAYWEKKWNEINLKYSQLNNLLTAINDQSQDYFKRLEKNNELIKFDSAGKQLDRQRTEEFKRQWNVQYSQAVSDLGNIGLMVAHANDFKIELTNTVARDNLKNSFDKLAQITTQAKALAVSINQFSINAKAIFSAENIPGYHAGKNIDAEVKPKRTGGKAVAGSNIDTIAQTPLPAPVKKDSTVGNLVSNCHFSRVWVQSNTTSNGQTGVTVYADFSAVNLKLVNCRCIGDVYYNNGQPLKSVNMPSAGQVTAAVNITPSHPTTAYSNLAIFIPYSSFPPRPGHYYLKTAVTIYKDADSGNPQKIAESGFAHFQYTVN